MKDNFDGARYYLRKKFGNGSDGAKVLDLATEKPESVMRRAMLVGAATLAGMETDPEIVRLAEELVCAGGRSRQPCARLPGAISSFTPRSTSGGTSLRRMGGIDPRAT